MGIPERQCIGCGRKGPQGDFIRLAVVDRPSGRRVSVVEGKDRSGRGAYLCRRRACLERALVRKAFQRAFRTSVEVDRDELESVVGKT